MNYLLVFDDSILLERVKSKNLSRTDRFHLLPLTSKSNIASRIKELLNNHAVDVEVIQTADLLNHTADKMKGKYIAFIAELPQKVNINGLNLKEWFAVDESTTLWWFSLISEKNTLKSDAFNKLVQLDAIITTAKSEKVEKMIFGCRSNKLKNALLEYCRRDSIEFEVLPTRPLESLRARIIEFQRIFYLKHISFLLYFASRRLLRTWKIKRKLGSLRRMLANDGSLTIITYYPNIDISSAREGIFKNKFYAYLQEALETKGRDITWIAMPIHVNSISFEDSLNYAERFVKKGHRIFFLEEFNSIGIQVKALLTMLKMGLKFLWIEKSISETHTFGDYNFYSLFRDEWYSSFVGNIGYSGVLYYNMFKSLLGTLVTRKCLYYCEMHAWEKALVSARDAVGRDMHLLSYQHSTVSPMLLNYFNHSSEIRPTPEKYSMPIPDRILCTGPRTAKYMEDSGWPLDRISIVEAIRFNHLKKGLGDKSCERKNIVLYASSISAEESGAIVNMIHEAFGKDNEVEVWIKCHPSLKLDEMLRVAGLRQDDLRFDIKQNSVESLLPKVKAVLVGETSVALEALAFGAKVVLLNIPEFISMSALRGERSDIIRTASSPEELRQTVIDIFREDCKPEKHAEEARRIVTNYFYLNENSDTPHRLLKLLESESV